MESPRRQPPQHRQDPLASIGAGGGSKRVCNRAVGTEGGRGRDSGGR